MAFSAVFQNDNTFALCLKRKSSVNNKIRIGSDGTALAGIYEYYVRETTVTFEYIPPSGEEFSARIADKLSKYPYIVAEEGGRAVGYAYASSFRERAAYNWDAELSVYVERDSRRSGIGYKLYSALVELLEMQNFVNLYAWITAPNPESITFHEKMGFHFVCRIPSIGYKQRAWHDIVWYQLRIGELGEPRKIIEFPLLDPKAVAEILENH